MIALCSARVREHPRTPANLEPAAQEQLPPHVAHQPGDLGFGVRLTGRVNRATRQPSTRDPLKLGGVPGQRRLRPCGSSAGSWPRTAPLDSGRSPGRVRGLAGLSGVGGQARAAQFGTHAPYPPTFAYI